MNRVTALQYCAMSRTPRMLVIQGMLSCPSRCPLQQFHLKEMVVFELYSSISIDYRPPVAPDELGELGLGHHWQSDTNQSKIREARSRLVNSSGGLIRSSNEQGDG